MNIRDPEYHSHSNQQFSEIDGLCDRFDRELLSGQSPRIETFLTDVMESAQDGLFTELLAMEIEYHVQQGEDPRHDDYLRRFPQHASAIARFFPDATSTHFLGDETVSTTVDNPPDLKNFRLIRELGSGGMGVVWLAEQLRPVKRQVALKLIKAEVTSRDVIARFDAEKQALAMMDHPHIASVLDAGTSEDGRPYFVMDLVDGIPITDYCDAHRLSVAERLELFVPVCNAVQHAHQKGVIHRDLKPSNVLVTVIDGVAVPKVIDFGLAKAVEQSLQLTDVTMHTEYGKVVGTLQYMSPEQAELKGVDAEDVDTRTDVYSLGVMLYELLTGSTPVEKDVLARTALLKVLEIIRGEDPPRPSHRLSSTSNEASSEVGEQRSLHPARLQQLLRGDLDWVVMKALEKDRVRRYQTANDLAQDITNYLSGDTVSARPPSTWYQLQKFARRNRGLVAALTAIAVALIVGIAGTSYGLIRANAKAAEADQERGKAIASEDVALAEKANAESNERRALKNEERAIAAEERAASEAQRARDSEADATFQLAIARFDANRALDARRLLNAVPPEYRDTFEWNYAKRRFQGSDVTCYGHGHNVLAVAFTPDGKQVVSASGDRTIKLWDAVTGQELKTFEGHEDGVTGVAVSPDGTRIASGGFDRTVRLWDAESGEVIRTMKGHSGRVNVVAFSPDGNQIASASQDRTIRLWNTATGEEVVTITGHSAEVTSIAFSPDGGQLASSSSSDGSTRIWDSESGELIRIVRSGRISSFGVAFSPDGSRLVTISYGMFTIWDTKTWQSVFEGHRTHNQEVRCVAFSPDGSRFACSGEDPTIKIRDTQSGREIGSFCGHAGTVTSVSFSPDGSRLASGSHDGKVKLWDIAGGTNDLTLRTDFRPFAVTFSDDDTQFAYCGDSGMVVLCDARTNEIRFQLKGHATDKDVDELAFSPDGTRLVSAGNDGIVGVWDTATGESVSMLKGHRSKVRSVAFSPDGTQFASASWDGTARLWDATTYEQTATLTGHRGGLYCVAFNPDGSRLATASYDGTLKLWDARTGEELKTYSGHHGHPRSVAFGPRGERMISAGNAPKIRVWDVASGESIVSGRVDSGYVAETTFSRDGTRFATVGTDKGIHLYDSSTGKDLMTFHQPAGGEGVRFSSNGRRLAVAGGGFEVVRIWDAPEDHETTFLRGHTDTVTRATFSADGSRIYSESENEKLVWDVAALTNGWPGLERGTSETPGSLDSTSSLPGLPSQAQSSPGHPVHNAFGDSSHHPAILRDAAWDPPEAPVRKSFDGRWFVTTEANSIVLVDLDYKNTPEEQAYRQAKARFDPLWHQQQAKAAVAAENWYAAAFQFALLLKHEPDSLAHYVGLQSSYRRLIARDPAAIEALSAFKDVTENRDATFYTDQNQKQIVITLPTARSTSTEESTEPPTEVSDSDHALYFNGASSAALGNLSFYKANFTVEGWIRMDVPSDVKQRAIFTVLSGETNPALAAEICKDGRFRVIHRNPPAQLGGIDLRSQSHMTDGQWHHFAVVKDDDDLLHLYIDGELEASSDGQVTDFGDTPYSVFLGVLHKKHPRYFRGLMDGIRFWNVARTNEEITNGMHSPVDPASDGLTAAYRFDPTTRASDPGQEPDSNFYIAPVVRESLSLAAPWPSLQD